MRAETVKHRTYRRKTRSDNGYRATGARRGPGGSTLLDSVCRLALVAAVPVALFGLTAVPAQAQTVATATGPVLTAPRTAPTLGEQVVKQTNKKRVRAGCDPL